MSKSLLAGISLILAVGCQGVQSGTVRIVGGKFSSTPQIYNMAEMVRAGGAPFSYQFSDMDCTTGKHEFASEEEFCGALMDERLNDYCAENARREYYFAQCGSAQSN